LRDRFLPVEEGEGDLLLLLVALHPLLLPPRRRRRRRRKKRSVSSLPVTRSLL
jgi:hypothetical protein